MIRRLNFAFCLAVFAGGVCGAQTIDSPKANRSASPIAYVYVTRPTHIDAFAAASDGKLTPVTGSPFPYKNLLSMSVSRKFLFGFDGTNVFSFSIASDGALKQVAEAEVIHVFANCPGYAIYGIQIDASGSTLYVPNPVCPGAGQTVESYRIESNGELQFLGASNATGLQARVTPLGNNKYAYSATCQPPQGSEDWEPLTATYTRESNGFLASNNASFPLPPSYDPATDHVCPSAIAADPTNHLALAESAYDPKTKSGEGPTFLASYSADAHGNLTTHSTLENMAQSQVGAGVMSISPTGTLLAVGGQDFGDGFQIFHFNGEDPITNFSGVLQPVSDYVFTQFGWDKHDHLYALAYTVGLFVYEVTDSKIKELAEYPINGSGSVIVLDK
jgi:hypothetical protein